MLVFINSSFGWSLEVISDHLGWAGVCVYGRLDTRYSSSDMERVHCLFSFGILCVPPTLSYTLMLTSQGGFSFPVFSCHVPT